MTFAGYNAGRGRVQQWVAQHGDPRDPRVDAVDWVERIPFAETRNYVQRVMENLQVYRARFDATATAPNLRPAESVQLRDKPTLVRFHSSLSRSDPMQRDVWPARRRIGHEPTPTRYS